jgi:O-antigen/teichoic acid export membrane protein
VTDASALARRLLPRLDGTHVRVGRVFSIVLVGAALQIVSQAILARSLSKPDVGLVSLILGIVPLLSTLATLGQDSAIVRFMASAQAPYDVRSYLRRILLMVTPLGLVAGLAADGFYRLAGLSAVVTVVLVVAQSAVTIESSALRGRHRYELAMLAAWSPAMVSTVLLALLQASGRLTAASALGAYLAGYAGCALALAGAGGLRQPAGAAPVPSSVIRDGFFFFGLSLSFSVMVGTDKLIIGKLMTYSDLAVYATVFTVMKGFDFLFQAVNFVMMPWVSRVATARIARYNAAIAAVAVPVACLYLLWGDDAVHLLYGGRYDQGIYLIVPFMLSGIIKLFYAVPSSIIGGRLPREALRAFLWFSVAAIVFNIAVEVALIRAMGLMGAALATAAAWATRYAGASLIVWRYRSSLGTPRREERLDI